MEPSDLDIDLPLSTMLKTASIAESMPQNSAVYKTVMRWNSQSGLQSSIQSHASMSANVASSLFKANSAMRYSNAHLLQMSSTYSTILDHFDAARFDLTSSIYSEHTDLGTKDSVSTTSRAAKTENTSDTPSYQVSLTTQIEWATYEVASLALGTQAGRSTIMLITWAQIQGISPSEYPEYPAFYVLVALIAGLAIDNQNEFGDS